MKTLTATAVLVAACASAPPPPDYGPPRVVDHVIDGDTIVVLKTGVDGSPVKVRVRLIGVDAPETPRGKQGKSEPCGKEATEFLTGFIVDRPVYLEEHGLDQYRRVLAYVWVKEQGQHLLANAEMIRSGYAKIALPAAGGPHAPDLSTAQGEAMDKRLGQWGGDCK